MLDEKVFAELAEMPATAPPLEELEGRVTRRRARRRIAAVGFALVVVLAMSAGALSLSARGNSPAAVVAAGGDAPSDLGQNLSCQTDSRAHGSADYSGEGGSATPQMAVTEYLRINPVLPADGYEQGTEPQAGAGSITSPGTLPGDQTMAYFHQSGAGPDVALTVVNHGSGWRVESAEWCPELAH